MPPGDPRGRMQGQPLSAGAPPPIDLSAVAHVPADNLGKRVGVLVVAYNAATTLARVLERIPPDVWANVEEVVVFDDASKDDTYERGVDYKAISGIEHLTIIKNERNLGYGGNQKLGFRYFMDKGFDVVVLLHGDGQYAPEILAHLYRPLVDDAADAVFGSRMMPDYGGPLKGGMPLYKYVGNRILSRIENRGLGLQMTEFHSGYRAYNLRALARIDLSRMTHDFHFDQQIIIKLHHQGFRLAEVPIPTYYGGEICYVNGMQYAWNTVLAVIRYRRTVRSGRVYPEYAEYAAREPTAIPSTHS
jgi:glycosyltransferase involved in cell wall biosynthesis